MNENKMRCLALLVMVGCFSSPVSAQSNGTFPEHVIRIYGPSDPLLDMKLTIEKMMGVYLTHPPRRHVSERISVNKNQVIVDVWQTVYGLSDAEIQCRAIKWLVFGRTQYGQGGRDVLSKFDEVDLVKLRFHEVIRKKNSRRRKQNKERVARYLNTTLKRQQLRTLNLEQLKSEIAAGECARSFKLITAGKLSRRHTKRRRKAR